LHVRLLEDSQVVAFDTEYVDADRWAVVKARLDASFPDGTFAFLDVGGGNGKFADRVLEHYAGARGTVLDSSTLLLKRNTPSARKELLCDSVENLQKLQPRYDVIFVHWLLHHLVGETWTQTRQNQQRTLATLRSLLRSNGRVSIFENNYTGWAFTALPGRLIYHATASRWLATLTRRLGANTAGVGVCFLSRDQWYSDIAAAGLRVLEYSEPDRWKMPIRLDWRVFLHLRHIQVGHYWLGAS
jgi:hypothetical protein